MLFKSEKQRRCARTEKQERICAKKQRELREQGKYVGNVYPLTYNGKGIL